MRKPIYDKPMKAMIGVNMPIDTKEIVKKKCKKMGVEPARWIRGLIEKELKS